MDENAEVQQVSGDDVGHVDEVLDTSANEAAAAEKAEAERAEDARQQAHEIEQQAADDQARAEAEAAERDRAADEAAKAETIGDRDNGNPDLAQDGNDNAAHVVEGGADLSDAEAAEDQVTDERGVHGGVPPRTDRVD